MSSYKENPADDDEKWTIIHPSWKSDAVSNQLDRALKPISTDSIRIHALRRMTERLPASLVIKDPAQFAESVISTFDNATGHCNAFFFLANKFTVYQNLQFAVPLRLRLLNINGGLSQFIYLFGNCQDSTDDLWKALATLQEPRWIRQAIVYMLTVEGGYDKLAQMHRGGKLLSLFKGNDENDRTWVRNTMSYNLGLRQNLRFMDDHEYPRSYSQVDYVASSDSESDSDDDTNNNKKKRTREEMEETDQDKPGEEEPVEKKKQATESSMDSGEEEEVPAEQPSSRQSAMILYKLTLKLGELPSIGDMKKHPEFGDFYWRVIQKIRGNVYEILGQKVYLMNKPKYDTNRARAGGITKSYFVLPLGDEMPEDALLNMIRGIFRAEVTNAMKGWVDHFKIPHCMVSLEGNLSARTVAKSVFMQTVEL